MPVSEDVPVAGLAAVAHALGIDSPPERARFIAEITRFATNIPLERRLQASALALKADDPAALTELVRVPLTTIVWVEAVFGRPVEPAGLVAAIIADREAALLCHGLAALDDETLQYVIDHPSVLSFLHKRAAPAFASFAGSLRIHDGRVLTPGGADGVPLWEKAVGEEVARPDRFIRELFSRHEGRLAYLYDGINGLDAPHQAFALGFWIPDPLRWNRFNALLTFAKTTFREWKIKVLPFSRPVYDVVSLLMRVRVGADGTPAAPGSRALWTRVLESDDLPAPDLRLPPDTNDSLVDGAWLAERLLTGEIYERGAHLDQFSLGQRVFSNALQADRIELLTSLRAFGRYPMLVLTLDRMGITDASVYAGAARHAGRLTALERQFGSTALVQFQSALALITRMRHVRSLELSQAQSLVVSLSAVPLAEDGYRGKLLEWIDRELRPLAAGQDLESGLIARLAGAGGIAAPPVRLEWEGQTYRLDLALAEERRLRLIREKQNGLSLDLALDLARVARGFFSVNESIDRAQALVSIRAALTSLAAWSKQNFSANTMATDPTRDLRASIERVADELARADAAADARRLARIVEPLVPAADAMAAAALLSLAYAVDLGDPDGPVVNAGNVAQRHDFGHDIVDSAERSRFPWTMPKQDVAPGVPWHVSGSALGLDIALAPLWLRRIDMTRVADAPRLTSNERQTFALSVALLNPFTMTDRDRDAIVEAIDRGTARVRAITPQSFDAVAGEVRLDGWRRRAVQWSMANDPERPTSLFSLTELMHLGGPPEASARDGWGMSAVPSTGCVCTRMAAPADWWNLTGRPQLGLLATAVTDVNLRIAVVLRDLGLPAGIARHVLSAAVQDYIDDVRPNDKDDWLTLVRSGQMITRERVEDYVAAVTADGPLIPETPTSSSSNR